MKKRILAVVALLCTAVCLVGCSSNQGVDVNSIEWVTEDYDGYFSFQIPLQWQGSGGTFGAVDDPNVPGGVSFYGQWDYETVESYMESDDLVPEGLSLETKDPMEIGGRRGYHYVLTAPTYYENGEYVTEKADHYVFEAGGIVFDAWMNPITDKNVTEYIIDSITLS